jgi:plasmid stabilization system protein ParE
VRRTPDYELSPDAERDLFEIAAYTFEQWGVTAAERYEAALTACLLGLAAT